VVRDLVTDRRVFFEKLRQYELFLPEQELGRLPRLKMPPSYRHLAQCRECLCCVAAYEPYRLGASDFESPYIFVKLAQLHFDPRDRKDRLKQARELGIEHYRRVKAIPCPFGISIAREALRPLMEQVA
jgi:succinate dehydrogenase/fumarate reductase-like Fe-S protein